MNNIVLIEKNQLVVPVNSISEFSGNDIRSVRDLINSQKDYFISLGINLDSVSLKDFKTLMLSETATNFLLMLMRNTESVVEFKFNLSIQIEKLKQNIELANKQLISSKVLSIKKLQEKVYAKPRGFGFETVFRIIADCEADISASDFNKLLLSEKVIFEEHYMATRYIPNQSSSLLSDGHIVIHSDTAKQILQKHNIPMIADKQQIFDFG